MTFGLGCEVLDIKKSLHARHGDKDKAHEELTSLCLLDHGPKKMIPFWGPFWGLVQYLSGTKGFESSVVVHGEFVGVRPLT